MWLSGLATNLLSEDIHHDFEVGPDIVEPTVTGWKDLREGGKGRMVVRGEYIVYTNGSSDSSDAAGEHCYSLVPRPSRRPQTL